MEVQTNITTSDFPFLSPPSGSDDSVLTSRRTKWPRRKRRHIPHSERPYEFVKRRNLREKRRVENLNFELESLRRYIPSTRSGPKESKINILREATKYIAYLNQLLCEEKPNVVAVDEFPCLYKAIGNSDGFALNENIPVSDCQACVLPAPGLSNSFPFFSSLNQDIWADGTVFGRGGPRVETLSAGGLKTFLISDDCVDVCTASLNTSLSWLCASR